MSRHAVVALAAVLTLAATGCGAEEKPAATVDQSVAECRTQWQEVAESIIGLDEDTNPSALATRWTNIAATVSLYENTQSATGCQANIETQVKAITLLREFVPKLQPYDMAFQLSRLEADVDLYLNDPLPKPTRNARGKLVRPPSKAAVRDAIQALRDYSTAANTELEPGWGQLATIELSDTVAVDSAMRDLTFLAQDSPNWRRCNDALKVIVTASQLPTG